MSTASQLKRQALVRLPCTKQEAVKTALANTSGDSTPSEPTWCYAWVRSVMWLSGVPHTMFPKIGTAKKAFKYYQERGWQWTDDRTPNLGDIIFWVSAKHGNAGHVEMYTGEWKTTGNSSLNITHEGDKEARGTRPLDPHGDWVIIRPPYKGSV